MFSINSFFLLCLLCSWNYDGGAADRLPRGNKNNGDKKKSGKVILPSVMTLAQIG